MENGQNTAFLEELRHVMARNLGGLSIDEIASSLAAAMPRRTLQRRLEELCEQGQIIRSGKARATRYVFAHGGALAPAAMPKWQPDELPINRVREDPPEPVMPDEAAAPGTGIRFTPEAISVRDHIRQPLSQRKGVGYRPGFLEAYVPNKTDYLPRALREHLRRIGQSEDMAKLPPGTYAQRVLDRLLIDLSWNSSRLEGNTYSLLETDRLLEMGRSDDPGRSRESQMILNHKQAIEFLVDSPNDLGYNRYTFMNLHALLTEGLLDSPAAEGGLRVIPVGITGTAYRPSNTPSIIEECFEMILQKTAAIQDELEQAFFLMVHLPYLQPFEDGNKRMSRLSANIPLIRGNLSPLSFVDVATRDYVDGILSVYELNRIEPMREVFAWAYERSAARYAAICSEIGDPDPITVRYREEIKTCVRHVVVNRLGKQAAAHAVRTWATQHITATDRPRFIELAEMQLLYLTEGRIVRMRLRPSEYAAWHPIWTAKK